MEVEFFEWGGVSVTSDQLDPVVQRVYRACLDNSSCEVLELKSDFDKKTQSILAEFADGTFDIDNSAGISRVERLSITYAPENDFFWDIRALRKDFPVTIHQNHVLENEPRSLCLYVEPWFSVERSWTPELFIKRIFWWLRETANGTIHGDEQPLEQLFFSSPYSVILPENYFSDEASKQKKISFTMIENKGNTTKTLIGDYANKNAESKPFCVAVPIVLEAVENGPVEEYPYTLGQLQTLLENRGSEVIDLLKNGVLDQVTEDGIGVQNKEREFVLLLIGMPRIRNDVIEKIEKQGFIVDLSFGELGEKLSVLFKAPNQNKWYREVLGNSGNDGWMSIPIFPISVTTYPTREDIRQYSGIAKEDNIPNGIIAGVGALGGLIAKIWGRECWGEWLFIDDDILKSHNIVRHISTRHGVGFSKSVVVDSVVSDIHNFESNSSPKHFVGSAISDDPKIVSRIKEADILIDATTTLYVPREISKKEEYPRTASVFITPSGMSSVMLLEDVERNIRCNSLEAQYYRAILNSEWGASHLSGHLGRLWVGAGCREITTAMSDELIHLHAAILSRQIRKSSSVPSARICVWDCQEDVGGVVLHDIEAFSTQSALISDWEVRWDYGFLSEAKKYRDAALPNETGGLLFGIIDQKDKTLTLVKACHAPDNSKSTPTSFERGAYESTAILDDYHERTGGVVTYVGEWHSHPQECAALPSQDDIGQLSFLTGALQVEGMPVLMLIVSDSSFGFYLDGQGAILDFSVNESSEIICNQ
jgi:integrative and conjugative element protein (TIGR02256 family)